MNLDERGFTKRVERPLLSGLPSLELLKLVTKEEEFDKWVIAILLESSTPAVKLTVSVLIRSWKVEDRDGFL